MGLSRRRRGPVLEVLESPARLDTLPVLTSWPDDGGPFITLPLVYTEHPGLGGRGGGGGAGGRAGASRLAGQHGHNLGMYRLHVYDRQSTGMHWQIQKGGGFHHAAAERAGKPLPVTVFLGGPPALILSAIAPLPENVPELLLASLLMGGASPASGSRAARTPCSRRPSSPSAERCAPASGAGGALRRPLRLLLPGARLPRVPRPAGWPTGGTPSTPPRWWASPVRRTSSSGTICRSCSAPSSPGHARSAGHLELRGDRLPFPRRCRGAGALRQGGPSSRPSASWAKGSSR